MLDVLLGAIDSGLNIGDGIKSFGFLPSGEGTALCVECGDAQGVREVKCVLAGVFAIDADGFGDLVGGLIEAAELRVDVRSVSKRIRDEQRVVAFARGRECGVS